MKNAIHTLLQQEVNQQVALDEVQVAVTQLAEQCAQLLVGGAKPVAAGNGSA
jgi:hypothetical protein